MIDTGTGRDIKRILAAAGISRDAAARALEIAPGTLANRLTSGRFSVAELKTLASLCGASIRVSGADWSIDI